MGFSVCRVIMLLCLSIDRRDARFIHCLLIEQVTFLVRNEASRVLQYAIYHEI